LPVMAEGKRLGQEPAAPPTKTAAYSRQTPKPEPRMHEVLKVEGDPTQGLMKMLSTPSPSKSEIRRQRVAKKKANFQ